MPPLPNHVYKSFWEKAGSADLEHAIFHQMGQVLSLSKFGLEDRAGRRTIMPSDPLKINFFF